MRKTPSKNMQKMYSDKKTNTLQKIQEAIDSIKEDNKIVTKKELISITNLSSGTFSKPYVLELLKKNKVCQFKDRLKTTKERVDYLEINEINELNKTINALNKKIDLLTNQKEILQNKLEKSDKQLTELTIEYQKLKGRYQIVLEKLDILGEKLDPKIYS